MNAPLRVLFVSHTGTMSGAELVLLDVVAGRHSGSAFVFDAGPLKSALEANGIKVVKVRSQGDLASMRRDSSPLSALPLAGRLARLTRELAAASRQHDVLYANSQKAFVLSAIASAVTRRPLVWHLHDIISASHFGSAQRRLQIWLANRFAACVIVPSKAAAAAFTAAGGRAELVRVVPNGLSITGDVGKRAALRNALGLENDQPVIGVFSRLAPWKGQHVVLNAMSRLPGVHCLFAGDALFGETDYRDELYAMTRELGLSSRVTFLGNRRDVGDLMCAVEVLVHPSVAAEPFGRTLVEAMLLRLPVVAADTGAPAEILEAGTLGTLVEPEDPAALAEAIRAVLHRSDHTHQLDHAQASALRRYDVATMRASIDGIIDDVGRRLLA